MSMTLDGVEHRFHVREADNRVAIVLSQPGWAAASKHDYWYLSIEDLKSTGTMSEGQDVKRWVHREGSTYPGGLDYAKAKEFAQAWYEREGERYAKKAA